MIEDSVCLMLASRVTFPQFGEQLLSICATSVVRQVGRSVGAETVRAHHTHQNVISSTELRTEPFRSNRLKDIARHRLAR